MTPSPRARIFGLAATMVALAVLAYLFGFFTSDLGIFPSELILDVKTKVTSKLARLARRRGEDAPIPARGIETILLRLRLEEFHVPAFPSGNGGGLTSVGNELVLLTRTGQVFAISGTSASLTEIEVPSNGLEEYKVAAATEKYRHMTHDFAKFRYNDILYYKEADHAALVISYTEWLREKECYGTTVARLALTTTLPSLADFKARAGDWQVIYRTQPCLPLKDIEVALEGHMAGGRIAYLGGDKIVLGSGEYHWDGVYSPRALSQDRTNDYGKLLEVDLERKSARILTIGNRNIQGVMVNKRGQTWAVEHGPRGGDELNLIVEGKNFGWPEVTFGTRYNHLPWPTSGPYGRHDGFDPPIFAWVPSVGTSNIMQIENFDPSWDGDFLVASLKMQTLFRLRMQDDRVVFSEPILIGRGIRYAHMHTDGRIVLWTDAHTLIFISRDDATLTTKFIETRIAQLDMDARRKQVLQGAIDRCSECHSFDPLENTAAPSLGMVFGRPIASTTFAGYSEALRAHSGNWGAPELTKYLIDPQAYAPGTSMPDPGLSEETTADVLTVLEALAELETGY